jgi:hypothetical protein
MGGARSFFEITYILGLHLSYVTTIEPSNLVQCQLCFDKIDPAQREYHLKEVHKVSAAAIDDSKPLTHWFRPAAAT